MVELGSMVSCLTPVFFARSPCGPTLTSIRCMISSVVGFWASFEGLEEGEVDAVVPGEVLDVDVGWAVEDVEADPLPDVVTPLTELDGSVSEDCCTFEVTSGSVNCWRNGFLLWSRSKRLL